MALRQGRHVGRDPLLVLDVDATSGQAEAPDQLLVAVPRCQVKRVKAIHVGHVDRAAERAQRLREAEQAFAGSHVDRSVAGGIGLQ